jgi:hypothetical protein
MGPIVADEGNVLISQDLAGAEPNLLLNYSDDQTLYSILYNLKGVKPYWDRGVLMTDNLYVTTMSSTPLLGPLLETLGENWATLWVTDQDTAKTQIGGVYPTCKASCLALLYGMQKARLSRQLAEVGVIMTDAEVANIYNGFWDSLPAVKALRDFLIYEFKQAKKKKQCYMSPMGFPLPTGKANDALNYCVQSGVSSWIRRLNQELFKHDWFYLIAIIHDELIVSVPEHRVEEYRAILLQEVDNCNKFFGLKYPMRLGFTVSKDFYGFKG